MNHDEVLRVTSREEFVDDTITRSIIGAAIKVHRSLGPGLLESAYQVCLTHELTKQGFNVTREVPVPVEYDGEILECGYRIDLLVNREVIVEVKAVEKLAPIHEAQLLTYLRLAHIARGLIINFNVPVLKDGVLRRVLSRPAAQRNPPRPPSGTSVPLPSSSASSAPLR